MRPVETVIYHANCDDGFCAAWLHWRHPERAAGCEYIPAQYGDDPPDVTGKHVLIFDFSYDRHVLERMHSEAASLRVFDHHKTAQERLAGLEYCVFDMDKSGGRLALEYLFAKSDRRRRNWLVDYTEDRDLWRWKLPESREVSAGLRSYPRDFMVWDRVFSTGRRALAQEGRSVLRYQQQCVDLAVESPGFLQIQEHIVPAVNCHGGILLSEIVGTLAEKYPMAPFAVGFFTLPGKDRSSIAEWVYSLRSRGEFDVSSVARIFGGGGHRSAAGFRTALDPNYFNWGPASV